MLFNSYIFIFAFLPISFFIYFYLNQKKLILASKLFLVLSSLFFYAWWNVIYLPIIISSIILNYFIGHTLHNYGFNGKVKLKKKLLLIFGITANITLLGYFKYSDFFIENYNLMLNNNIELLHLALPLAISFFTFQQISYLVDSYKSEIEEYNFINYALFVTFFPQLIAGPIVHHKEMMPQFSNVKNKIKNYKNISMGLFIFSIGLFKKVVIADTFAIWATAGFDTATTLNLIEAWITSLSYTFQLYFDFSGYTDMAIGIALLFNIKLPMNFNSPYKATDIQDFWRRWHMTLGRFLKDYVYIPLGGNRKSELRTYHNLLVTFLLAGIWHGAGWTFLLWGFLHGLALVIHRAWSRLGFKLWSWMAWLITFNFINATWIFFRAKEWEDAIKVLSGMVDFNTLVLPIFFETRLTMFKEHIEFGGFLPNIQGSYNTVAWILGAFILILFCKNSMKKLQTFKANFIHASLFIILFVISFYKLSGYSEFLYFRF
ncbi:MAG: Probable poly(beta-D-mannuronate) O-acetylase (EC [uncultured Sulfurovum sp.]|uniref:Probable poly(Beta-D-mannuronate) O-acetylase (EC) n=1 Tax=uncultured Sulfurovum sp. TaxID=269237 RepID=A0A6S6TS98_9BACT|nr:MAG: Probable poly(beta-D-mannuronate) O-acetylase (EC [uncultured Sulfurovum sp.]